MTVSLDDLRRRRDYDCRLTPDRALESLDQAHDFLRERGLLTRTPDSALPSLFEACHDLRAAVLAPEKDLVRWFSWRWLLPGDLADQLAGRGLAIRPAPGWLGTTAP